MSTVSVINEVNPLPIIYIKNSLSLRSLNNLSFILSKQVNASAIITSVLVFVVILNPGTGREVQSQKWCDQHASDSSHRCVVCFWCNSPQWAMASSFARFYRSHTTTHHSRWDSSGRVISSSQRPVPDNTQQSQQSMPPVGFEPTISAGERP